MSRGFLASLALTACGARAQPAPAPIPAPAPAPPTLAAPAAPPAVAFQPLPEPLPLTRDTPARPSGPMAPEEYAQLNYALPRPVVACDSRNACEVIRDLTEASSRLASAAERVDFSRFMLVSVEIERTSGPELALYDGSSQPSLDGDGVVVELPADECPYCGGATPPRRDVRATLVVIRIPSSPEPVHVRSRPSLCPCDPSLP